MMLCDREGEESSIFQNLFEHAGKENKNCFEDMNLRLCVVEGDKHNCSTSFFHKRPIL